MRCVASVCPAVLGNNLEGDVLQTACQLHPQAKSGLPHDSEAIAFSVVIDAAILKIFQKMPNSYQAAPHSFAVRQQAARWRIAIVFSVCLPTGLCRRPLPENRGRFRYCFDSDKARQTVRWGHFRGLKFALKNRAECAGTGLARPLPLPHAVSRWPDCAAPNQPVFRQS